MRKVTRAIASMESIDFQRKKSFFNALTQAIAQARQNYLSSARQSSGFDPDGNIKAVIKKHTGLNCIGVNLLKSIFPSCHVEYLSLSKHDVLLPDSMKNVIEHRGGTGFKENIAGTVNLKDSSVSGAFSDLPLVITISDNMAIAEEFPPEQVAAIFLHELGHVFTSFEYLAQTARRSVIIANATEEFFSTKDKSKRLAIINDVSSKLDKELDGVRELVDLDDEDGAKRKFQCIIEYAYLKESRNESGNDLYGKRSAEQLADQFAARHGASKELVLALDKLKRAHGDRALRSSTTHIFTESGKLLALILAPITPAIYWPASVFFLGFLLVAAVDETIPEDYDRSKERLVKLRAELNALAKDRDMTDEQRKILTEDAETVDRVIEAYVDRKGIFEIMQRALSSKRRKELKVVEVQQELEKLANNELYMDAVRLKNITYKG